jgi:hypothetical protein
MVIGCFREDEPANEFYLLRHGTIDGAGIVNLTARGMLVVSVAPRLGSEGPLPAYCAAHSNRTGPEKGAPSLLS